jgi:hypothetical protein
MVDTPRMDASAYDDGAIWETGCDIERELNAANDRIKRLEEALEGSIKWIVDLANSGDIGFYNIEEDSEIIAARAALKAKEAKL